MKKRKLPNVEDVANRAGVSTATVSRCLNEPRKVSEKTRNRVMAAVRELHYAPNFGARAIAANRTGTYGVIIPTMENAIFARGVEAFQQALVENNATMLVASSGYDAEREADLVRTLVGKGADGLLLIGTDRDPEIHTFLEKRNIPFVIAWAVSDNPAHSFCGFDNRAAARAMVERAVALGHRRFGFISARTEGNDRARARVAGARDAISAKGLEPDTLQVIETGYDIDLGAAAFRELMGTTARPGVVFCGNDVLAVGAVRAARDMGLRVPKDVSVTGFDDIELARIIDPPLATVHVPHGEMGRRAAKILMELVADPTPQQVTLPTRLVEGGSLGAPGS